MEKQGIHRVTVDDGVELAGHVYGHGPAVVFLHGSLGDGETYWTELTRRLSDRFRCYLMDMRGTGKSSEHHDLSPERQVRDVTAFVESIGEPVGVFGTSGGAVWTLGTAAQSEAIAAAAVYEPGVFEVQTREQAEAFKELLSRINELADQGKLSDAGDVFNTAVLLDEEWELIVPEYIEGSGRYVRRELREMAQVAESDYSPTAPGVLEKIDVPLLLLTGTRGPLSDWFHEGVRYVAGHVQDAQVRTLEGLGHAGPVLQQPDVVAGELRQYFERMLPRAEESRPEAGI